MPDHQNLKGEELQNSFDEDHSSNMLHVACSFFIFSGNFIRISLQHDSCSGRLYINWFVFRLWKLNNRGILLPVITFMIKALCRNIHYPIMKCKSFWSIKCIHLDWSQIDKFHSVFGMLCQKIKTGTVQAMMI